MKNHQKQKGKKMDERQKQINYKAMSISWVFLTLYLLSECIYRIVNNENFIFQLIALYTSFGIISLSRRIFGDVQCPEGITGKPLPCGYTKEDKKKRHIDYLLEGIMFSGILTLMLSLIFLFATDVNDVLLIEIFSFHGTYNMISVFIICVVLFFTVVTGIGYFACSIDKEQKLKEYNRICDELDKEEPME